MRSVTPVKTAIRFDTSQPISADGADHAVKWNVLSGDGRGAGIADTARPHASESVHRP